MPFCTTVQNGSEAAPWVTMTRRMSSRLVSPFAPAPVCSSLPQAAAPNNAAPAKPSPPARKKLLRLISLSIIDPPFASASLLTLPSPFRFGRPPELPFEVSWLAGEGVAEPLESPDVVAGGECLEPYGPGVADAPERAGDGRVMDLARSGLAAAGHVGHLHLSDGPVRPLHQFHQVRLDERQRILRAGERHPGMVYRGVEVLQAVRAPGPLAELGEAAQIAPGVEPHLAGGAERRLGGPTVDELGRVHDEPWAAELLRRLYRLFGALQERPIRVVVDEAAPSVAGHGRERGAGGDERVEVLLPPVPDLDGEAEVVYSSHPFLERQAQEHHLGAHSEVEPQSPRGPVLRYGAHRSSSSSRRTGQPASTDRMAVNAVASAFLASSPVHSGRVPLRTQSTKCASSPV